MGNSIYYGIYSKECNNDKVLPYLSMNPEENITDELFIDKESQKEFFDILRKYSIRKEQTDNNNWYYRCYIITNYEDYCNLCSEANIILPEDTEYDLDFENDILIFWVA